MEELVRDIKYLLIFMAILLTIATACQVFLVAEKIRPSRAEARNEEIMKVDLVKVGGYYISKWEFLRGKK